MKMMDNQTLYFSLQTLYTAYLVGQLTLKLAKVNPRLGVVTLSLSLAAADLGIFLLLLGCLLFVYACAGHVLFGAMTEDFSTVLKALTTCLHMLMGDTGPSYQLQMLTDPLKTVGMVFFWSFMLLVFTLLLNFVLAIICDAYVEVKEATASSPGIFEEAQTLLVDFFRHVTGAAPD